MPSICPAHYIFLHSITQQNCLSKTKNEKENLATGTRSTHYPAAAAYLELLYKEEIVSGIIARLKKTKTVTKKAKDILRASRLPLLPKDNIHVKENLQK